MRTFLIYRGRRLSKDAAASYERMRAAALPRGGITSAYRSIEFQRAIFLSRYERSTSRFFDRGPFHDVRTYNGVLYKRVRGLPASVPGTSKHNEGLAIDTTVGRPVFTWLHANGGQHGWHRPLVVKDPVHWEYRANKDKSRNRKSAVFEVTAKVLRGRDRPSLSGKIVSRRRRGTTIIVEQWVKGDGMLWGRTPGGVFFAKEFLKRQT